MFRKNKKIVKFLIGALILSLPATLKVSAMENNPANLETNVETTQKDFYFSDDEEFDLIFEDRLKYLLKTIFIEDLREYALCYSESIKKLNQNNSTDTFEKLDNLHKKIIINFRKENKKFIEQNIKNGKNKKVNFYYYEYFLNCLYDRLIFSALDFLKCEIEYYFKEKKNCKEIIDSTIKHKEYIFEKISKFIEKIIHKTGNEKFYNIPEKYASFEEYIEKNPEKAHEIDDIYKEDVNIPYYEGGENNMLNRIDNSIDLNKVYGIVGNILKKIYDENQLKNSQDTKKSI